jgi:hypothetical protein
MLGHQRRVTLMGRPTSANQCRQQFEAVVIDAHHATARGHPVTIECARGAGHAGGHQGKISDKIQWDRRGADKARATRAQ